MSKPSMYVVEARHSDGSLNVSGAPPPFHVASEDQLFDYYFDHATDDDLATWQAMEAWFNARGWYIRKKHW